MCQAIERLYPGSKYGVGPAIENGFFYDIEIPKSITETDLPRIEKEMKLIIESSYPFIRKELKVKEAIKIFTKKEAKYKIDILKDIENKNIQEVSIYSQGEFTDLCRGPHIPNTSYLKYFKLLSISGAYWKNNAQNPMLHRIYGISFSKKEYLKEYLINLEKAKEYDHRNLGKKMKLFHFHKEAPGMPFWEEKGLIIYNTLKKYIQKKI